MSMNNKKEEILSEKVSESNDIESSKTNHSLKRAMIIGFAVGVMFMLSAMLVNYALI